MESKSVQKASVKMGQPLKGNELRNVQPTNFRHPTHTPIDHLAVLRNPIHPSINTDNYVSAGLHNTSEIYAEHYRKKINFNREVANGQHRHLFRNKTNEELDDIVEKARQIGQSGADANETFTLAFTKRMEERKRADSMDESRDACEIRDRMLAVEGYYPEYWEQIRKKCEKEEQNQLASELYFPETMESGDRSTRDSHEGSAIEAQTDYDEEEDDEDIYGPESLYSHDDLGPPTAKEYSGDIADAHGDEVLVIEVPAEDTDENDDEDDQKIPTDTNGFPSTIFKNSCDITDAYLKNHDQRQITENQHNTPEEQNTDGHKETEDQKPHIDDKIYRPTTSLRRASAPACIDQTLSPYKPAFTSKNASAISLSSSNHHEHTDWDNDSQIDDEAPLNPLKLTPSAPQLSRAFIARAEFLRDYRQACKKAETAVQEKKEELVANELEQSKEAIERNELICLVSLCINFVNEKRAWTKNNIKNNTKIQSSLWEVRLCGRLRETMEAHREEIHSYIQQVLDDGEWTEIDKRKGPVELAFAKRRLGMRDDYSDYKEERLRLQKMGEDASVFAQQQIYDKAKAIDVAIQTVDLRREHWGRMGGHAVRTQGLHDDGESDEDDEKKSEEMPLCSSIFNGR